ncbi:XkdQ/YqbQ family protein [Paenibacillus agilis]|uniref:YqbQ/XkdQ domain-containing protein n=1 Tax=Paenibacillus agilis TaxID=3020863 RepID=A0A559IWE7_9BACL|nr:hypothetical protein [Paenibacillus agilis]TVX91906.1 hypothetical protein FPZ44_01805 [Paenibacillus agilis]
MIQIYYQDKKTGTAYDITTLVTDVAWNTKRVGSPASFEFTMMDDKQIVIEHGGILSFKYGNKGLFYGYLFKYSKSDNGETKVVAYDQLRYLKNKDTYVFKGKSADQIVAQIAGDFKLKTGQLSNTGYVIPSMVEDSKSLFDIILKALDLTLVHGKQMFYLWDDYGQLRISDVKKSTLNLIVGDHSLATSYDYSSNIDGETANQIKLVRDNKETGKRDVYVAHDSHSMARWGVLQHYEKVDEDLNKAQIDKLADNLLALKNRPEQSLSVEALADLTVRAGCSIFVKLSGIGLSGWYIVDECKHDVMKETMNLKLVVM